LGFPDLRENYQVSCDVCAESLNSIARPVDRKSSDPSRTTVLSTGGPVGSSSYRRDRPGIGFACLSFR
jgi:hypothetical protein